MSAFSELKPYRLEWRANILSGFLRITELDEHPGNLQKFVDSDPKRKEWGGYWRLISQHVIEEI